MACIQPLASIVRSRAAPRALACTQHLCFSTTRRIAAAEARTKPSPSSTHSRPPRDAKPSSPFSSASSASSASSTYTSSRTWKRDPATAKRELPHVDSAPAFVAQSALPPPTYHVTRTKSNSLPIYTEFKRGGNLHLTTVRKITGSAAALRDELRDFLDKATEDVTINSLTGHVVVKGHHSSLVGAFLKARGM